MKKFLLVVLAVVVLVTIGTAVYVSMIDWNQHKTKIAASLYDMTGKKISFDGKISVSLFPTPTMTAQNVSVFNPDGAYAQKPLATIKNLVAKVSLSSLFGGDFDVSRVSAQEPEIFFEVGEKGTINWHSDFKQSQTDEIRDMNISLDSVTLENAKLHFIYPQVEIDTVLSNLNAEIIAENVFGPYRIEGSYTKGENPEGFAISIGQLGENISTSINMAVNYPASQSYIRYDGTVYFRENKILGSVAVESEKPADFFADVFDIPSINPAYNQKFALTAAINTDISKVELSSVALQYGKTAGAGNVLIPLPDKGKYHPKVEMAFNMTDLDLDTPAVYLKNLLAGYETKTYEPWGLNFDVIGDVKALKSSYKNENLKNLDLSFDFVDNKLLVRKFKIEADAQSQLDLKANVAVENGGFTYNGDTSFKTQDLAKMVKWLTDVELKPLAPATLQTMNGQMSFNGNLQILSVPSYQIKLDNMQINGSAGMAMVGGYEKLLVANVDNWNGDNYLPVLPKVEAEKSLDKRLSYVFRQLDFLKNQNLTLSLNVGQGVLFHEAFENLSLEAILNNGNLNITQFGISNYINSSLLMQGIVSGFGDAPKFENLQYNFDTTDMANALKKLDVRSDYVNWNSIKTFSSKGVMTGDVSNVSVRAENAWDKNALSFVGHIDFNPNTWGYNGQIGLKSPDLPKLLENVNVQYSPRAFALGSLDLQSDVAGDVNKFVLSKLSASLGTNKFDGEVNFDKTNGRPNLVVKGKFNLLEVEKFLPEQKDNVQNTFLSNGENSDFLSKGNWSSVKFDFSPLAKVDVSADVVADQFVYKQWKFTNLKSKFDLKNSNLNMQSFDADFWDGKISVKATLDNAVTPILRGQAKLENVLLTGVGGKKYALRQATVSGDFDFNSEFSSELDFMSKLNLTADLKVENVDISGWNLAGVKQDILTRKSVDGISESIAKLLQSGGTMFSSFSGKFIVSDGNYKLEKGNLKTPDMDVGMQAEGSLINWTLNALFDVVWVDKNVLPFSFSYSGGLDNPILAVDVSKIVSYFNNIRAKQAAEEKAVEDAKNADLTQKLNAQFNITQSLKTQFNDVFLPMCNRLLEVVQSEYLKNKISDIRERADKAVGSLDEALALKLAPLPTEENLQKISLINQTEKAYFDENYPSLQKWLIENVGQRFNDAKANVVKSFSQFSSAMQSFEQNLQKFTPRLVVAQSKLNLDDDPKIRSLKQQIQSLFADVSGKQAQALVLVDDDISMQNIDAYESNIEKLNQHNDYLNEQIDGFKQNMQLVLDLAEALVSNEEKTFAQNQQALAQAQKIKAETGTIANDSTGEVRTVVPQSSSASSEEENGGYIKVLDFSKGDIIPVSKTAEKKTSLDGVVVRD